MSKSFRKIIVTCALPYANGPIHLGHILESIQADIWVRYQRMRGNKIYFISADDAHGTPIMLKARELGITPEEMISKVHIDHRSDFKNFNISYDNYYSSHSEGNRKFSELIYGRLKKKGLIKRKIISQFYDSKENVFLPDRFIKGVCPKCKSLDQYGDGCEICGSVYSAMSLIDPISVLSGVKPEIRESDHFFFDLSFFEEMLKTWINSGVLQVEARNKVKEWFKFGLKSWDISRDFPYFGFKIPDVLEKYFYVWLDAPITYISAFENLSKKQNGINFNEFWKKNSKTELYHFIGKDIMYFHSIFWPSILEGSDFRKPNKIFVHGYVMVNGLKMSKSRGTFITASTWLKYLDSDSLRYYYATKLSKHFNDINLNLEDFAYRVNADIINKVVNLASRTAGFISNQFFGKLSSQLSDIVLYKSFCDASDRIAFFLENCEYSSAIRKIMEFADIANTYINEKEPWIISKKNEYDPELQDVCSMGINMFRILMTWLKPILPILACRTEKFLNKVLIWEDVKEPLLDHEIAPFKSLYKRIEKSELNNMLKFLRNEGLNI